MAYLIRRDYYILNGQRSTHCKISVLNFEIIGALYVYLGVGVGY